MAKLERSRAARNGLPVRLYRYNGTGEDIHHGATGTLEDVRRRAVTRHLESAPDISPGPEWYRELAAEAEDPPRPALTVIPLPAPAPARVPALAFIPPDSDGQAETAAARDRYQAAMALAGPPEPGAPPAPPPVTAASRCGQCGYLTTAAGHRVMCDG